MVNQVIEQSPLIESHSSYIVNRTGSVRSAVAHIITALIGAGVLSLSWSIAQLGWIAGPLVLILFAIITLVSSSLICDCYRFPDPEYGTTRISSYVAAVKLYLGETTQKVAGVLACVDLFGTATAYVITTATSTKTAYVMSTTGIAILFPYFNQVLGVKGALNFWPLAIYFPVEMYLVQKKIQAWTRKWIVLRIFSFVGFLVTVVGLVGSIEGIVSAKLG